MNNYRWRSADSRYTYVCVCAVHLIILVLKSLAINAIVSLTWNRDLKTGNICRYR